MNNALISIKPEYVRMILCGEKSIEIRNRSVNLDSGTRLWIYSTLPKGRVEAVARIRFVRVDSPSVIWKQYSNNIGISLKAFLSYVNGSRRVSAVFLDHVYELKPALTLADLRSEINGFHPPQFLKRIEPVSPLMNLLRTRKVKLTHTSSLPIAGGGQKNFDQHLLAAERDLT